MAFKVARALELLGDTGKVTTNLAADSTTEWDNSAIGAAGVLRKVTTTANGAATATYRIYESLQATTNNDPTTDVGTVSPGVGTYWKEVGTVNEWAWAGNVYADQSERSTSFYVEVDPGERIDAVYLGNIVGTEFNITITSALYGTLLDQDYSLTQDRGLGSWYDWFFEPIVQQQDYAVFDLPSRSDMVIRVTITGTTAKAGAILFGKAVTIGDSLEGASFSFQDYSRANYLPDANRTILTERGYTRDGDIDVLMKADRFQYVQQELLKLRNKISFYAPAPSNQGTPIMGYLKNLDIVLSNHTRILANIQVESVT